MSRTNLPVAVFLSFCAALWSVPSPAAEEKPAGPEMHASTVAESPEWTALKSLAGHWQGEVEMNGQMQTSHVELRMTGDGSALMHVMDRDTPHEMVTMFHPDGKRLLATHYCAAHNQPRMALVRGSKPDQMTFEFFDGTNIGPADGHMKRLVITVIDADHHDETWTYFDGAKETPPMTFHYARKK